MQKLEKWAVIAAALVTVVGFPLLLVSVWFAYHLDIIISQQKEDCAVREQYCFEHNGVQ
jgi:hypothetical protein